MTCTDESTPRFEDRLLAMLQDEQARRLPADGTTTFARASRPPRVRRRLVMAGAAALTVGAVSVPLVLATENQGAPSPAAAPTVVPLPALSLAAVRAKATAAIDQAADMVLHVTETRTGDNDIASVDSWWDGNDGRRFRFMTMSAAGTPVYDMSMVVETDGTAHSRFVDYAAKTWWEGSIGGKKFASESPEQIQARLNSGALVLVGPEEIDGVATVHLRDTTNPKADVGMWVDARTYLPVFTAMTDKGNGLSAERHFTWLPRTAANASHAAAEVPAGFRQVPAPEPATNADGSHG